MATILLFGGIWRVWVLGSCIAIAGAIAVSMYGILILRLAIIAVLSACRRHFGSQRRWALHTFIVASGVWFMRLCYIA